MVMLKMPVSIIRLTIAVLVILTPLETNASVIDTNNDDIIVKPGPVPFKELDTCQEGKCIEVVNTDCLKHQIYDSKANRCLSLAGEICEDNSDCIPNSSCTPVMSTTLGRFVHRCTCPINHFKTADGNCKAFSKYGEYCDASQHCEPNSPLITCVENVCTCSDKTMQVYDRLKKACVLRLGQHCHKYGSVNRNICITNAQCTTYGSGVTAKKCQCIRGYISRNSSIVDLEIETCAGLYGQSCNETNICDTGLVCTDGKCLCNSPLHQIFDSGKCRSTVGARCGEDSPCVSNALCIQDDPSRCECKEGFGPTLSEPKICKLGYGSPCTTSLNPHQFQCNHDRGLVCKNGTCSCYDPALLYQNSSGICTNEVGQVCGVMPIRTRLIELLELIGRKEHSILNQNAVTIACGRSSVCGKVQGHEHCKCLDIETIQSDRANKIEYCLPLSNV